MDEHPHDLLPGYALGALDAAETTLVFAHLRVCPGCRDEVESFHSMVSLLPYTTHLQEPPAHVKQQLFARIAATQPASAPATVASSTARSRWFSWPNTVASLALVLMLMLGGMTWNMNRQLQDARQQIAQITSQAHDSQMMAFMVAPSTVSHMLASTSTKTSGKMFMQPGATTVVLMADGLQPQPGQAYRCWVAKANQSTAVCTLTVNADGTALMMFHTPAPIDSYEQIMITLDPMNSPATQPSNNVVLKTSLT